MELVWQKSSKSISLKRSKESGLLRLPRLRAAASGSTFTVTIPCKKASKKEEGCIVEVATDEVACISMIEKADADYYKMILMDIQMPVMNGFDTTLTIRKMKDDKKAMITLPSLLI